MSQLEFKTAVELVAMLTQGEVSSLELTEHFISRIEALDQVSPEPGKSELPINAVVVKTFDHALECAREADAARARGEQLGPLHGLPMTIKESYALEGTPTTWGMEAFKGNIAQQDGLAVRRFRQAGAHFLGKTNVPVELADFQSYNPIYGVTGNPHDTGRTPGGSSGGSAAALAAGFTGLEAGSDIGGSIRNPAHFCGVYGHKPTYGVIPLQGHELVPGMPDADLAVCGPLARGAEDLHLALDIMAGPTDAVARGWQLNLPASDLTELRGLRVALWPDDAIAPVDSEVADWVVETGRRLSALGATVSDTARPNIDLVAAHTNYQTLLTSVMSASMTPEAVAQAEQAVQNLDPHDLSYNATSLRASLLPHREWIRANAQREQLRHAWDEFFTEWDILIAPQTASAAFKHDHSPFGGRTLTINGTEQAYFDQLFWAGFVVNAYLPSTVFPAGRSSSGLPIGLQAIGQPYQDHKCIEFARLITQELGGFEPPKTMATGAA